MRTQGHSHFESLTCEPAHRRPNSAFTLVEMMVAVALVTILMTMFAQIFGLASNILSQQRGVANNDQSERMLRTIFREDLNHRTFQDVTPFASEDTPVDERRKGYFHITEGVISDDTDDVLQFTIMKEDNDDPIYGRAQTISGSVWGTDLNQPEFDDEYATENDTGASRYGELAYFLRNGNLYRRVMLIREPKVGTSVNPQNSMSSDLITGPYNAAPYNADFWNDFDYSAYYYDPASTNSVRFIGTDFLINEQPQALPPPVTINGVPNIPLSLGVPRFRWGFDVVSGQPRRMVKDLSGVYHHIGRFTQQETSDPDYDYPGGNPAVNNWLDPATDLDYDTANGVLVGLEAGPRVSEDILLKNVHAFDIQVWDPAVSLGPDNAPGRLGFDDDFSSDVGPDQKPGIANTDDDGINGIDDAGEIMAGMSDDVSLDADNDGERGWPGSDDGDWRDLGHNDPSGFGFYRNATNAAFGEYPVGQGNGNCFDTWHPNIAAGAMPGSAAPYRPFVTDRKFNVSPAEELPQPLRMIRIHIRYVDQKSDQMRDVIIVHTLMK